MTGWSAGAGGWPAWWRGLGCVGPAPAWSSRMLDEAMAAAAAAGDASAPLVALFEVLGEVEAPTRIHCNLVNALWIAARPHKLRDLRLDWPAEPTLAQTIVPLRFVFEPAPEERAALLAALGGRRTGDPMLDDIADWLAERGVGER